MFRQSCLDEFDYTIKNLCVDLRDGVRLVRLAEIWTTHSSGAKQILDTSLSQKLRLPTVSRLQKIHNVKLALEQEVKKVPNQLCAVVVMDPEK